MVVTSVIDYHHGNHGGNAVIDHNMVIMVLTMVVVLQCGPRTIT